MPVRHRCPRSVVGKPTATVGTAAAAAAHLEAAVGAARNAIPTTLTPCALTAPGRTPAPHAATIAAVYVAAPFLAATAALALPISPKAAPVPHAIVGATLVAARVAPVSVSAAGLWVINNVSAASATSSTSVAHLLTINPRPLAPQHITHVGAVTCRMPTTHRRRRRKHDPYISGHVSPQYHL